MKVSLCTLLCVLVSACDLFADHDRTPVLTDEQPAPGRRVRQVAHEYAGTDVHHSLYLPTDWRPDQT